MVTQNSTSQSSTGGAADKIGDLRDRASTAFSQFSGTTAEQIDNSPLIALAGGIAIGAILAAVLPASERETQLLQPVGTKVTDAGKQAVDKARQTGKAKVDELAGDKVREFFGMGTAGSSDA